jgi:hypothetical protein
MENPKLEEKHGTKPDKSSFTICLWDYNMFLSIYNINIRGSHTSIKISLS